MPRLSPEFLIAGCLVALLGAWAASAIWRWRRRTAVERQIAAAYRDVVPLATIHLDRDGTLIDANRKTSLMLGREPADILGRNWFALALPPEYRAQAIEYFRMGFDPAIDIFEVVPEYTNEILGANGQRRTVEWSANFIYDASGQRASMLCVGRDVTDERIARAEAARARAEIDAFRRLAQQIASLDDARQAVVDATLELCGADAVAIAEPDRQRHALTAEVATEHGMRGLRVDLRGDATPLGEAFLTGETVIAPAATDEAAVVHQPIVGATGTRGVLTVVWREWPAPEQEHALELVRLVSHEAAVALRRRESLAALERAALIDPLTSVANRRAFDAELLVALRRAADSGKTLSLVLVDLNHFKAINDEHGHEAGDRVLVRCAAAWADVLRAGDLLARIGGDEFAVILPACDDVEILQVIARLRHATPHERGAAVGGATWDGVENGSQFVRRADEAQYRDKAIGRGAERPAPVGPRSAIDPARPGTADPRETRP